MTYRKFPFALVVFLAVPHSGRAQAKDSTEDRWIPIGVFGNAKTSADKQTIGLPSDDNHHILTVWTKHEFTKEQTDMPARYQLVKMFWSIDCGDHTLRTEQMVFYDKKGNSVYSSYTPGTWTHPTPETLSEVLVSLCPEKKPE